MAKDAKRSARWNHFSTALADGILAGEQPWEWRFQATLDDGSFATMPCTEGMRTGAQQFGDTAGGNVATWDVTDAPPGGDWMMSGPYVAIAPGAAETDAVVESVAWLTASAPPRSVRTGSS